MTLITTRLTSPSYYCVMKKLTLSKFITAALILFAAAAITVKFYEPDFEEDSENGIHFYKGSFRDAVEQARNENKLIFMDVYATWCGPCKMLKMHTFSSENAGEYFNERFVNISIDGEKGTGVKIAKKYGVEAYPSLFIIDPVTLEALETSTGYKTPGQLISFADKQLKTESL